MKISAQIERKVTCNGMAAAVVRLLASVVFVSGVANAQIGREAFGRLFFSFEERNVLEAVRQGVVDTGAIPAIGSDIFIPEVEVPEISFAPRAIQKTGNTLSRGTSLSYQGLIRHHRADGGVDGRVIINHVALDEEQQAVFRDDLGLNFRTDRDDGALLYAEDKLFKTNVALDKNSVIQGDGMINRRSSSLSRFIVLKRDN